MEDTGLQQTVDTNISHIHLTLLVIRTILTYIRLMVTHHIILLELTCIKMKREFTLTLTRGNVRWIYAMLTIVRGKLRN